MAALVNQQNIASLEQHGVMIPYLGFGEHYTGRNESAVAVERRRGKVALIDDGALASLEAALRSPRPDALGGIRISMPVLHVSLMPLAGAG